MSEYMRHLLFWILPFIVGQWFIGRKILLANLRAVVPTTILAGAYFSATDLAAIRSGIWHFDEAKIQGIHLGPVPLEEILFFFLTALLVAQSVVLLLPARLRW